MRQTRSNPCLLTQAALCALACLVSVPASADSATPVIITIDAAANRKAISPDIYGVAWASPQQLKDLRAPLNRFGGNDTTQYNWAQNANNQGNDWYFASEPQKSPVPGERADTFIGDTLKGGAIPMLTVPMIGWVAKLGPDRSKTVSFSIKKYGPQQKTEPGNPDVGNGVKPDGTNITGNDPNDANMPADANYQRAWIRHIVKTWGLSTPEHPRYYFLDNEPSIWQGTHRDVHPIGPTMDEIAQKSLDYAAMIKSVDPHAIVAGPEEWGWGGYIHSGFDQQYSGDHHYNGVFPDQAKHGGEEYSAYLLDQFDAARKRTGKLPVDVFTLHCYPQGGEGGDDVTPAIQQKRNRSTRSFWDVNYTDESWINDKVKLIPRMRDWVAKHCPGIKIGITEYNWGAEGNIGGATAEADILGIFGREGLDIATRWTTPDEKTPTFKAMKMYRNYDDAGSSFGSVSVSDVVPNPDELSSFAAIRRSDHALTVMVINKSITDGHAVALHLSHFPAGAAAQVWRLTSSNSIDHLPSVPVHPTELDDTIPAQSISLYVIPRK